MRAFALFIHLAAVIFWLGGIFFVQVALRPALAALDSQARLQLMARTLTRYFTGVALSIALIVASGAWLMLQNYGSLLPLRAPVHVQGMAAIALVMLAMFLHTVTGPFRRLREAVAAQRWDDGAAALARIRAQGAANLTLGLGALAVGMSAR